MANNRIPYIDTAKTICIFLMVVGHWTSNEMLWTYIYSFHMPAFFVVSGFLYRSHSWIKTIISFGIPVVFYSILNLFFLVLTQEIAINDVFTGAMFFRFFHYRYGLGEGLFMGDWFIWALLALRLFYGDISFLGVLRKYYIYFALFAIVYMSFEDYLISVDSLFHGWYIGRALPSMPFLCFGFYLKERGWSPNTLSVSVIIFLFVASILLPCINGGCSINGNIYGLSYFVFLVNAIASTLFLFYISSRIGANKHLAIISKGTLLILGLHMPILKTLEMLFPIWTREFLPLLVLPLCYYPIKWLVKWCPELLGKIRWSIIR